MPKPVIFTISHDLGREAAIQRIRGGVGKIAGTLGSSVTINERWEGDTLHFDASLMGQTATGKLDVRDKDVLVELLLPGFLGTMAGVITSRMQKQGQLLLEKK